MRKNERILPARISLPSPVPLHDRLRSSSVLWLIFQLIITFQTGSDRPVHQAGRLQNHPRDAPISYEQGQVKIDLIDIRSILFHLRLGFETLNEFHDWLVKDRNRRQLSRTMQKNSADRSSLSSRPKRQGLV